MGNTASGAALLVNCQLGAGRAADQVFRFYNLRVLVICQFAVGEGQAVAYCITFRAEVVVGCLLGAGCAACQVSIVHNFLGELVLQQLAVGEGLGGMCLATSRAALLVNCQLGAGRAADQIFRLYNLSVLVICQFAVGEGQAVAYCITFRAEVVVGCLLGAGCAACQVSIVHNFLGELVLQQLAVGEGLGGMCLATSRAAHLVNRQLGAGRAGDQVLLVNDLLEVVHVISKHTQLHGYIGGIQLVAQLIRSVHSVLTNYYSALLNAEVLAVFVRLLKGAQSTRAIGNTCQFCSCLQLAQSKARNIHCIAVAQLIIGNIGQDCGLGFSLQSQSVDHTVELFIQTVLANTVTQLLSCQCLEDLLQLVQIAGFVVYLDSCNQLGLYSAVRAVCQDHCHCDDIVGILGEVHLDRAGYGGICIDHGVILDQLFDFHGHINSDGILHRASQLCQFILQRTGDHNIQRRLFRILGSADIRSQMVTLFGLNQLEFPGSSNNVVGGDLAVAEQCGFQSRKVSQVIDDHIDHYVQRRNSDPVQTFVDDRIQFVLTEVQAEGIIQLDIQDLVAFNAQAGSIQIVDQQTYCDLNCQIREILFGGKTLNVFRSYVQDHCVVVVFIHDNREQLVADNTVFILGITVIEERGNIVGELSVQDGDITGDSAVHCAVSVCLVSAVHNDQICRLVAIDITGDGLTVQIQNSGGTADVQIAGNIVQQDDCGGSRKYLGACNQFFLFPQIELLHHIGSFNIQDQCCVIGVEVGQLCICGDVQTGSCVIFSGIGIVVLVDQICQIEGHTCRQFHLIDGALQLADQTVDRSIFDGQVCGIAVVSNIIQVDVILDHIVVLTVFTQVNCYASHSQCVGDDFNGDLVILQSGLQQIQQIADGGFCVNIIHIVQICLAGHSQHCQISAVCLIGQGCGHIDLTVLANQGDAHILGILQAASDGNQVCAATCQGDIELCVGSVLCICAQTHRGLQQDAAQLIQISRLHGIENFHIAQIQVAGDVAVLIDQVQQGLGTQTAVHNCVDQCLDMELAVEEGASVQTDVLVIRHKQADGKVAHIILECCRIHPQHDGVLAVCILGQNCRAVHTVDQLDQGSLSQVHGLTGNGQFALSQALELCQRQCVGTGGGQFTINIVSVLVVGIGVLCQSDLTVLIVDIADQIATDVNRVFTQGPGCGQCNILVGNHIAGEAVGYIIIYSDLIGQAQLCSQFLCPGDQVCVNQGLTEAHILGCGLLCAIKVNEHLSDPLAGTGLLNGSHPNQFAGCGELLFQLHSLCCFQSIYQGAQIGAAHIDQFCVDSVLRLSQRSGRCQNFLDGSQHCQLILEHIVSHNSRVRSEVSQQIVQLCDLCDVGLFISVIMKHTLLFVGLQRVVQRYIAAAFRDHRKQFGRCILCSLGNCDFQQAFQQIDLAQSISQGKVLEDHIGIVKHSQQAHDLIACQRIDGILLVLIIGNQLIGSVDNCQQLLVGNAQSGSGDGQFVVHNHCIKAGVFVLHVDTVNQIHSDTVDDSSLCDPALVAHSGRIGQSGDGGGLYRRCNDDLILTGHADADGIAFVQCLVLQNVLYQNIHIGISVDHQVGQILLRRNCADLTGDRSIFCDGDHSALIQVDLVIYFISVFILCIAFQLGQGHTVAIGNLHRRGAILITLTEGHVQCLGSVGDGVGDVFRQQFRQSGCAAVIIVSRDCPAGQDLIFICLQSQLCQDLSGSSVLLQGEGVSLGGQINGLHRVHLCGVDHFGLEFHRHIEHIYLIMHHSLSDVQRIHGNVIALGQTVCLRSQVSIIGAGRCVDQLGSLPGVVFKSIVDRLYGFTEDLHHHNQRIKLLLLCLHIRNAGFQLSQAFCNLLCQRQVGAVEQRDQFLCLQDLSNVRLHRGHSGLHLSQYSQNLIQQVHRINGGIQSSNCLVQLGYAGNCCIQIGLCGFQSPDAVDRGGQVCLYRIQSVYRGHGCIQDGLNLFNSQNSSFQRGHHFNSGLHSLQSSQCRFQRRLRSCDHILQCGRQFVLKFEQQRFNIFLALDLTNAQICFQCGAPANDSLILGVCFCQSIRVHSDQCILQSGHICALCNGCLSALRNQLGPQRGIAVQAILQLFAGI